MTRLTDNFGADSSSGAPVQEKPENTKLLNTLFGLVIFAAVAGIAADRIFNPKHKQAQQPAVDKTSSETKPALKLEPER